MIDLIDTDLTSQLIDLRLESNDLCIPTPEKSAELSKFLPQIILLMIGQVEWGASFF